MLLAALFSDLGTSLQWWKGVRFLSAVSFFPLAGLLVPLAIFSGIKQLAEPQPKHI